MKYERPDAEVVQFENGAIFMSASGNYSSAAEALAANCPGYNGGPTNNFSCSDFGGYNASNKPTQNVQVVINGTAYVFDYKGNHWKLHK